MAEPCDHGGRIVDSDASIVVHNRCSQNELFDHWLYSISCAQHRLYYRANRVRRTIAAGPSRLLRLHLGGCWPIRLGLVETVSSPAEH